MVREDQVLAAAMNIEALAEVFHRHRGALDMPARAPRPDLGFPESFPRFRRLPQGKVARFFLVEAVGIDTRAIDDRAKVFLRKLAVLRELRNAEVVRAVVGPVSVAFF